MAERVTHYVQILIKSYNHTKYNHCQTDSAKNIDLTESDAYRIKGSFFIFSLKLTLLD